MERRHWLKGVGAAALAAGALQAGAQARPARPGTQVELAQLPAWRNGPNGRQPLVPGEPILAGDDIQTGEGGAVVIRLAEGTIVRIGEKARLGVPRYSVADEEGRIAVRANLQLFEGAFRCATSVVSKVVGRRDVTIQLRTATIGIRGTDFWLRSDDTRDAACVFEGSVAVQTQDQGSFVLDKPTAFWVRVFAQPPRPVGTATPDELQRFLGSTELRPGTGVTLADGRWRVVLEAGDPAAAAAEVRAQGFPAVVEAGEVRVDKLATAEDARFVLQRLGGRGRVVQI